MHWDRKLYYNINVGKIDTFIYFFMYKTWKYWEDEMVNWSVQQILTPLIIMAIMYDYVIAFTKKLYNYLSQMIEWAMAHMATLLSCPCIEIMY